MTAKWTSESGASDGRDAGDGNGAGIEVVQVMRSRQWRDIYIYDSHFRINLRLVAVNILFQNACFSPGSFVMVFHPVVAHRDNGLLAKEVFDNFDILQDQGRAFVPRVCGQRSEVTAQFRVH